MPIIITQIKGALDEPKASVISKALRAIKATDTVVSDTQLYKTSLDARRRDNIHFVHSVYVKLCDKSDEQRIASKYKFCSYINDNEFQPKISANKTDGEVVVVGFGPAGMFAGLVLAEYGYNPIIIERGEQVDDRALSVDKFWKNGILNPNSNVQFGEGGAGTFSDGKLTTRISDPLCRYVLEKFAEHGAPKDILTKAKPHVGTDKIRKVVKSIRERIIELGGEVRFNTCLENMEISNGKITKLITNNGEISPKAVILAIGHSARDTFEMLLNKGVFIEPKAFSIGARIEHRQDEVNMSLYGEQRKNPLLPQGEYQHSLRMPNGRAVYTFCMCPGGTVVPSSSEENTIVTNGMSEYARDLENANSALVVSVSPEDFGKNPLDGITFIRNIEQNAFKLGGGNYKAPSMTVGDFLKEKSNKLSQGKVSPTYNNGVTEVDLSQLFPEYVIDMMKIGLVKFGGKMSCFNNSTAVLTAPETRTSAPIKILRGDNHSSISLKNLYPSGEGAGYAGGIMSAAIDGIKCAISIMEQYAP